MDEEIGASAPKLGLLAEMTMSTSTRTWQSAPHPYHPIVATASSDKSVTVSSLRDFRLLSTITGGHKRSIRSVAWRDAGTKAESVLATGSFDSTVGIWKRDHSYSGSKLNDPSGFSNSDSDPAEDFMENDVKQADDQEDWQFAVLLTGHDSEVKSVAFSPSNPALLATSSRDKSVWIWEAISEEDDYETLAVLSEHNGDIKHVAWHPEKEVLASASYDDSIRLWRDIEEEGDWGCIGCIDDHEGTVWCVEWEPRFGEMTQTELRLASCSDDLSIRIWKKVEPETKIPSGPGTLPSIIRPASSTEVWTEDAVLPLLHSRTIYAISWSKSTGLLVSGGGDGNIFVYKEYKNHISQVEQGPDDMELEGQPSTASWKLVAQMNESHGDHEINHVCWARREDPNRRHNKEEIILSTGDDGVVRVWTLPEDLIMPVHS